MNRTERNRIAEERTHILRRYEVKYFPKVKAVLKGEINHVINAVKSGGIEAGRHIAHSHIHSKELPKIIEQLYQEVGLRFARNQWRSFNEQKRGTIKKGIGPQRYAGDSLLLKGFGFNAQWVEWIKNYLYQFLLDKITFKVAETTRDVMLTVLDKAIADGWGIDKTVQALEDLPLSETQAARIVRTEITRAANTGLAAASDTFGYEQSKEWIAVHDDRTRGQHLSDHASHIALDGQVINEGDAFIDPVNGDRLMFPGDVNASAASVINCRCNVAYVAKVNERGRLIPKVAA